MVTHVRTRPEAAPLLLAGLSILLQIGWILVPAGERVVVTTLVVIMFTAASLSHAYIWFGRSWTLRFAAIAAVMYFTRKVDWYGMAGNDTRDVA